MQSPSQSDPVKKQEDEEKPEKRDVKPLPKTLNRVPRKSIIFELAKLSLILRVLEGACVSHSNAFRFTIPFTTCVGTECLQKTEDAMRGGR